MPDSSADRDPLDRLAEEFVARYRAGERPSLTEYAERLPGREDEVRDLFPALVEMEQLKPATGEHTGAFEPTAESGVPDQLGDFRILRQVGRGGMGVVYEAVQESLGRHVALKLLPIDALADPRQLERFRREAKSAARLHHTNIVPVFGVGEADGRHYYAMQFITGHPLDAVIDEMKRLKDKSAVPPVAPRAASAVAAALMTGTFARVAPANPSGSGVEPLTAPLTQPEVASPPASGPSAFSGSLSDDRRHYWSTVARIGAQVADALAYAHAQGVHHRDIKPANLLLDLRGTVWVTDFGLAKSTDADDLTHAGDIVGTLRYMAPERFDGSGDHRADIYALGLTLYELLTLKPAFVAENRAKLVEQVLAASPPKPRSINPAIPRDLETVVLKAIARDPAMRYQSASELADDLRRFTEDRPILARRASSTEQAWRWCRRNPAVAGLITAVILVFAAGTTVASFFAMQAERKEHDARTSADLALENAREATTREREANEERDRAKAQTLRANRLLNAIRINEAQAAANAYRTDRLETLLDQMKPAAGEDDFRGWEWHYLRSLNRRAERVVSFTPEPLPGVPTTFFNSMFHFNRDCRRVLITEPFREKAKAKDWNAIATSAWRLTVRDTETGRPIWVRVSNISYFHTPGAALSPDGRLVAAIAPDPGAPYYLGRGGYYNDDPIADPIGLNRGGWPSRYRIQIFDTIKNQIVAVSPGLVPNVGEIQFAANGDRLVLVSYMDEMIQWQKDGMRAKGPAKPGVPDCAHIVSWKWKTGEILRRVIRATTTDNDARMPREISPDGTLAVVEVPAEAAKKNGSLEVWDIELELPKRLWAIEYNTGQSRRLHMSLFSPSGTQLMIQEGTDWIVHDARTGKIGVRFNLPKEAGQLDQTATVTTGPDGKVTDDGRRAVFATSGGTAFVGQQVGDWAQTVRWYTLPRHTDTWAMSRDGGRSVSVSGVRDPTTLAIWDLTRNPEYARLWLRSDGTGMSRGRLVTTDTRGEFVVFERDRISLTEVATGKAVAIPLNPSDARISPGGHRLLTIADKPDPKGGPESTKSFALWNPAAPDKPITTWASPACSAGHLSSSADFTPSGRAVIDCVFKSSEWVVRSAENGAVRSMIRIPVADPQRPVDMFWAVNPAETQLAVLTCPRKLPAIGDRGPFPKAEPAPVTLRVFDLASGNQEWTVALPERLVVEPVDANGCLAPHDDVYDPPVFAYSPDGSRLAVGGMGAAMKPELWLIDVKTHQIERELLMPASANGKTPTVLAYGPQERLVAGFGTVAVVWDARDSKSRSVFTGHVTQVSAAVFSPDCRRLFILDSRNPGIFQESSRYHSVRVWDLTTDQELLNLPIPPDSAVNRRATNTSSEFREPPRLWLEGERLYLLCSDGVRVWDGTPAKE